MAIFSGGIGLLALRCKLSEPRQFLEDPVPPDSRMIHGSNF